MTIRQLRSLCACALFLTACQDRGENAGLAGDRPDTGGTMVIAIQNEPAELNSLLAGERWTQEINRNVLYLPLITFDEKLGLKPVLAESWQMEGDSAVTFKLRRDVFWHDGAHTTAHDVAFTFERGRDPATGYPNADYWAGWKSAVVIDSFTVRFTMEPQPEVLANLPWIPVMPRHLLANIGAADLKNAPFNSKPVGNGPFKFVERRANDRLVFEANQNFPSGLGGRPYVDRLIFRVVPEPAAQEAEIRTGSVHFISSVSKAKYPELDRVPGIRGIVKPGLQQVFVVWNGKRAPYSDARLRRALTFAIDRQEILDVVRGSYGQLTAGPVPPSHWSIDPAVGPLPYNVDSARTVLAGLGMRDVDNDGFIELPNGRDFRIELKYAAASEAQRDIAELIRADLDSVGIRVVPRALEFGTLIEQITSPARDFDATLMGFESDFRLVLHDMFHSRAVDNPFQFASYKNAAADSLIDQLAITTSRQQATPLWRRLQTIVRDDQPWTFLFYYSDLFAARDELQGPKGDVRGVFVDIAKWWIARPDSASAD